MSDKITNLSASVRRRLLNLRDPRGEDFQIILNRFGLERFLYRLSKSSFFDKFILKGAFSFEIWGRQFYRQTRDMDFLAFLEPSLEKIRLAFIDICRQNVESDGLTYSPDSISVKPIHARNTFGGFRVNLTGHLGQMRIQHQFDIVIGKSIEPIFEKGEFPTILTFPAPVIFHYPKAFTVADKFHSICKRGLLNSRIKDYYDLYQISQNFSFEGIELARAMMTIFEQERMDIPSGIPAALSESFGRTAEKRALWRPFLSRIGRNDFSLDLSEIMRENREFVLPISQSIVGKKELHLHWPAGGPWRLREKK